MEQDEKAEVRGEPRGLQSELGRGSKERQEGKVWRGDCVRVQEFAEQLDVGIMTSTLEGRRVAAKVLTGSVQC